MLPIPFWHQFVDETKKKLSGGSKQCFEMRNKLISTPESNFPMATFRGYRNENGILISNPNASMAPFLIFVWQFTSHVRIKF